MNTIKRPRAWADVLALGFGASVAMWTIGYVGRLPTVTVPSPVLFSLFVLCLLVCGVLAGRWTVRGVRGGAAAGAVCGAVNLLVLLSLFGGDQPGELRQSALWALPAFLLLSAMLAALGAAAGARRTRPIDAGAWPHLFARVAVGATLLLLAVGGLVTSHEAGMAVYDWPRSFGYNMFLFPLSKMTGGVYYEHAHRLFGALVGLTTLVMAVVLSRNESRPAIKRLGWVALVMVVVQGILGGLRVTEINLTLAMVHGILAQVFFATLVTLAVLTSRSWRLEQRDGEDPGAGRGVATALVALILVQLVLGAIQRHYAAGLVVHVTMAIIVANVAIRAGVKAWAGGTLKRVGQLLVGLISVQLLLGFGAFLVTREPGHPLQPLTTTAHQWCGATLLGLAVTLMLWAFRLERPRVVPEPATR